MRCPAKTNAGPGEHLDRTTREGVRKERLGVVENRKLYFWVEHKLLILQAEKTFRGGHGLPFFACKKAQAKKSKVAENLSKAWERESP